MVQAGMLSNVPVLDVDPFSRHSLADPYPLDELIREAGPLVWLDKYGIWATGRYDVVERIFRDHETFESSAGTGLTNTKLEENWRKPSVILEADPPEHGRARRVMMSVLSPKVARGLKSEFMSRAEELVDEAAARGQIDAAKDLAEAFPLRVLPDALGLAPEGRRHLLPYANLNFQAQGPRNDLYQEALQKAGEAQQYVAWQMRREALDETKLAGIIFTAADNGDLSHDEASMLVRTFLSAGLDTTILGIGQALKALAENPQAWEALRADPGLARTVFEETLRCFAPSPIIGRTTTREVEIEGIRLQPQQKVVMLLSAANHDPRRWVEPERFDITRDTRGHLAFGTGIHGCVGQMMARMEAECLLTAVATRIETLEITGTPVPKLNNWLRGFESIPMRITAA
jgi:4-methoxybenzoate monooxygenase (O-demethylating)